MENIELTINETLVWYDIPQLFTATDANENDYICLVYDTTKEGNLLALGSLVSSEVKQMFLDGKFELGNIFKTADADKRVFDIVVDDIVNAKHRTTPVEDFMLPNGEYYYESQKICTVKNQAIMTQEEKKLVIKEFCARLPYGLKLNFYSKATNENYVCTLLGIEPDNEKPIIAKTEDGAFTFTQDHVKPYLRPVSSMTETEKNELRSLLWFGYPSDDYDIYSHRGIEIKNCLYDNEDKSEYDFEDFELLEEFLFKNHFDFRGLIEKGLALAAPEGMYN